VNHGEDITPDFSFEPNDQVCEMAYFHSAFTWLSHILRRRLKALEAPSCTPQTQSPITTVPTIIVTPPADPPPTGSAATAFPRFSKTSNESGPSTSESWFAMKFLEATFFSIDRMLERVDWYRRGGYRIKPTCVPCLLSTPGPCPICGTVFISFNSVYRHACVNSSDCQSMNFRLGPESGTVFSDGGLSLYPNPKHSTGHPILCIEVPPRH
jgi:hypothetical protein